MQQEAERGRRFARRALLLGGAQLAVFGGLAARLWQLQVEDGARYALLAEANRANERLLAPPRGRVLDRHGRLLAGNLPTFRLRLVREQRSAALVATHNERLAARMDRVVRLHDGVLA